MAKKPKDPKDDLQKHIDRKSRADERAAGHNRHDAFCPKCEVWYKSNDASHEGH